MRGRLLVFQACLIVAVGGPGWATASPVTRPASVPRAADPGGEKANQAKPAGTGEKPKLERTLPHPAAPPPDTRAGSSIDRQAGDASPATGPQTPATPTSSSGGGNPDAEVVSTPGGTRPGDKDERTAAPASGWASKYLNWVAYLAVTGAVLAAAALGLLPYLVSRLKRAEEAARQTRPSPTANEFADLSRRVEEMRASTPIPAGSPRDLRLSDAVKAVEQRVQELQEKIDRQGAGAQEAREYALQQASRSADRVRTEFAGMMEALTQDQSRMITNASPVADAHSPDGAAEALASAANAWMAGRSGDGAQLLAMAEQSGLRHVQTVGLTGGLLSANDASEVVLDFANSGPWVATPVPGSADLWIAPADVQFLTMGSAPMLLSQMFRGMEGAQPGFRFAAIYLPSRVRPVPGRAGAYTLQSRGILQLEGAPAPAERRPAELEAFVQARQHASSQVVGRPLGELLGQWIKSVARQLEEHSSDLLSLQEEVSRPQESQHLASASSVAQLARELESLRRSVDEERAELHRRAEASADSGTRPSSKSSASSRLPAAVQGRSAAAPSARSAAEGSEVAFSAPDVRRTVRKVEGVTPEQERALTWAAHQPGADPDNADVPSPEVYLRRVQALAEGLASANGEGQVSVCHFVKRQGAAAFDLHPTEATPDGAVECRACHIRLSWQLGVLLQRNAEGELEFFLPVGTLGKSNYAPGYSALIEDVPSGQFYVSPTQEPALLGREERSGGFPVLRKLTLDASGQTSSLRV